MINITEGIRYWLGGEVDAQIDDYGIVDDVSAVQEQQEFAAALGKIYNYYW